jgi:hypothetical protein
MAPQMNFFDLTACAHFVECADHSSLKQRPKTFACKRTLSTPVRFAESGGPRLLLGAEPTIRLFRANITATSFHVVDTAVAHDFGTKKNLSFD